MPEDRHIERLMAKLLRAIEASLEAREAAREVVEEILRPRDDGCPPRDPEAPGAADPGAPLSDVDREFLRSISIRPETG